MIFAKIYNKIKILFNIESIILYGLEFNNVFFWKLIKNNIKKTNLKVLLALLEKV